MLSHLALPEGLTTNITLIVSMGAGTLVTALFLANESRKARRLRLAKYENACNRADLLSAVVQELDSEFQDTIPDMFDGSHDIWDDRPNPLLERALGRR